MKKAVFKLLGLGMLGCLAVTGCCCERSSTKAVLVTPGGQIAVHPPRGAPQAAAVQPPPKVAYVWVRGYWTYYSGNWGQWVWLPGHFEMQSWPGEVVD